MAVSTDNAFSGPYLTNGVTTVFPFTFTAPSADEVSVILRDAAGFDVLASGYAVALVDGGGGSITFTVAPASGYSLYALLDPSFRQDIAFENGSAWRAEPVNEGYDRSAIRDQALKRDVDRGLRAPLGEDGLTLPGVDRRADKALFFAEDGSADTISIDDFAAPAAAFAATAEGAASVLAAVNGGYWEETLTPPGDAADGQDYYFSFGGRAGLARNVGGAGVIRWELSTVASQTSLLAGKASLTDLSSPTGLNLLGNGTNIVLGAASAKVDVPQGNPYAVTHTKLSLKMLGSDIAAGAGRSFTLMAGVDNGGQVGTDNTDDMVAGYFGATGSPYSSGDSDTVRKPIWAINALTQLKADSGTYNARVAEFDFSNGLRNIGSADGAGFVNEVLACGLEVFNSGFHSTAGVLVNVGSDGSSPYHRGFAVAPGAAQQAGFADYSNSAYSFDSRGNHAYGLHLTGAYSNGHVIKGALSVGLDGDGAIPDPQIGITLDVWGTAKVRALLDVGGDTNLHGGLGVTLDGSLKAVSVGAANSGGTGFKVLRVAN